MKFIHLADCHLADKFSFEEDIGSLIREKSWESLANILDTNKDVDFALIAGDLFERNYFSSRDFRRLFDIFEDFGKDIYYVSGNHDYFDSYILTFFNQKPANLHVFYRDEIEYFERDGVRIYGMSYLDRIVNKDFDYSIKLDPAYFNILLVHGDIFPNPTAYLDLDPNKLEAMGFDYVALGHIHQPIRDGICYYPASIEPLHFGNLSDCGYILFDDGKVSHINSALTKFYNFNLDLTDFENIDQLITYVNDELYDKINFVRLNIKTNDDLNTKAIIKAIEAEEVSVKIMASESFEDILKLYPNSLLSKFRDKFDGRDDEISRLALEKGIDAILRSRP